MPEIVRLACRCRDLGVLCPIVSPMTETTATEPTPRTHYDKALAALEAAQVARWEIGQEYAKPTSERDYNRIGDLRSATRHAIAEAQVQALLHQADVQGRGLLVVPATTSADIAYWRERMDLPVSLAVEAALAEDPAQAALDLPDGLSS